MGRRGGGAEMNSVCVCVWWGAELFTPEPGRCSPLFSLQPSATSLLPAQGMGAVPDSLGE